MTRRPEAARWSTAARAVWAPWGAWPQSARGRRWCRRFETGAREGERERGAGEVRLCIEHGEET